MTVRRSLGTVEVVEATPKWARRDDGWWAGVGAALALAVGLITALTARGDVLETTSRWEWRTY